MTSIATILRESARSGDLNERIRRLMDDLSRHGEAMEEIVRMGERAVAPLAHYLASPPQSIPHARRFAVQVLGAIAGDQATEALRQVLYGHDLRMVDPVLAQSEYVVKNEAVEQLLRRDRADLADDFCRAFRVDRLPAAARAVARLRITAAIPDLVAALGDDVLDTHAMAALRELGASAVPALLQTLREHPASGASEESRSRRQRRLLAAITLGEIGDPSGFAALRDLTEDPHPAIAASAALALWRANPSEVSAAQARCLVQGSLSPEWRVSEYCRNAVRTIGSLCIPAALEGLKTATTLNLYGIPVEVPEGHRHWLLAFLLETAPHHPLIEQTLASCPAGLLIGGLRRVHNVQAAEVVARLCRHCDSQVRRALAQNLARLGGPCAAEALIDLLEDREREVYTAAAQALRTLGPAALEAIRHARARRRPWRLGTLRLRLRLWRLQHQIAADARR